MLTKLIPNLILILSLLANVGAFLLIKNLYLSANQVRLDPLQLSIYAEETLPKPVSKKRVVFFGDSRALSWPAPDETEMFEFINRGIGNQTSEQIRLRYDAHVAPLEADIIVLQLCVNDLKVIPLKQELRESIVNQCENNLLEIINKARQQNTTVIISTVFPLGAVPLERRPFWSNEVTATLNEVNAFIVAQKTDGVIVFPGYKLLLGQEGQIKPEYSKDLLHLNAKGYATLNQSLGGLLKTLQ